MEIGYILRVGDQTTCGGVILTGDSIYSIEGKPAATESSIVSCGKHTGKFIIIGGVDHITTMSGKVAGTLDSVSSCLCKALFTATSHKSKYGKNFNALPKDTTVMKGNIFSSSLFDEKIQIKNSKGKPIPNIPYFIITSKRTYQGVSNIDGLLPRISTDNKEDIKVYLGVSALEKWI